MNSEKDMDSMNAEKAARGIDVYKRQKYRMEKSYSGSRVHMEYMEMTMSVCHSLAPTF